MGDPVEISSLMDIKLVAMGVGLAAMDVELVAMDEVELVTMSDLDLLFCVKQPNTLMSSCLDLDPVIQYKTALMLWFRYCNRIVGPYTMLGISSPYTPQPMAPGPVKIINTVDTVTHRTVPLTADLLQA